MDHTSVIANIYAVAYFMAGLPLGALEKDLGMFIQKMIEYRSFLTVGLCQIFHQTILNLIGKGNPNPTNLEGEVIQNLQALLTSDDDAENTRSAQTYSYVMMQLAYFFQDKELALSMAKRNESFNDASHPAIFVIGYPFARAMIYIDAARKSPRQYTTRAAKHIRKLRKMTAAGNVNMHPMWMIAKADFATLSSSSRKDTSRAKIAFDQAITTCKRSGLTQHAALSSELCGRYMVRLGNNEDDARTYLQDAIDLYHDWDAEAKAQHLQKEFRTLLEQPGHQQLPSNHSSHQHQHSRTGHGGSTNGSLRPGVLGRGRRNRTSIKGMARYAEIDATEVHKGRDSGFMSLQLHSGEHVRRNSTATRRSSSNTRRSSAEIDLLNEGLLAQDMML